jgi:hypothetical protein
MAEYQLGLETFLIEYQQNAAHLMWFLGAGTSRSANLPTASDITWDLKRRYYTAFESQSINPHDLNNKVIKSRIQSYMDSKGYPKLWSDEEYSFYFELLFKDNYEKQQRYLEKILNAERVSLNVGHRVLASLIKMKLARLLFTTNFDSVVELAYSKTTSENINAFNLEGSYAALDALNNDVFPIYVKLHGDFRYKSVKNLSRDLQDNDEKLKICFHAAATRFGLVISGYSGRDSNVMRMLTEALELPNAFPKGIYWTLPRIKDAEANAVEFISLARSKGINAFIVETGTFDELMSKIWRQIENKPHELKVKVNSHKRLPVSVPLPPPGANFPLLRTNMLPIDQLKLKCGAIKCESSITYSDLKNNARQLNCWPIYTYTDRILYWGDTQDIIKLIPNYRQVKLTFEEHSISAEDIKSSTFVKSFVEKGLVAAICRKIEGIRLQSSGRNYFAVINDNYANFAVFNELSQVLGFKGKKGTLTGSVPRGKDAKWSECIQIGIEENCGEIYLSLRPDIWISPKLQRQDCVDFLRDKKRYRYNSKIYQIYDAWIKILFGSTKGIMDFKGDESDDFYPILKLSTRTAFSMRW